MISAETKARAIAAFEMEAKICRTLATQWAAQGLDCAAVAYRRSAKRFERFASEWRSYPIHPATHPPMPLGPTVAEGDPDEQPPIK